MAACAYVSSFFSLVWSEPSTLRLTGLTSWVVVSYF